MTDQQFPVIEYAPQQSPSEWGHQHGETFRQGIRELVAIRRGLMQEKNPQLTDSRIATLAQEQWQCTEAYSPALAEELQAIAAGAAVSLEEIVILNNYTDFRDIQVPDQGCSVVAVNESQFPVVGQTWDMHGSAKHYVCCLVVPQAGFEQPAVLFSLVGCVGMMGFHPRGTMVGVNNINTDGAQAGALWPCVVRQVLSQPTHDTMEQALTTAPVTSGHAYLLASQEKSEFWEVMPGLSERIDSLAIDQDGAIFHTNHCIGPQAQQRETVISQNSTTHIRYDLINKKIDDVRSLDGVYELLNDHENYPKSICSNFQTNAQDPSITCGGAVGALKTGVVKMWRGDPVHDDNFLCREFTIGAPQNV